MVRDKKFYTYLLRLAIPISLQNFLSFAIGFADNLMVGRLGEYAIAGVYMGNQIQTFLQFFVTGIDAALLIIAAQYWGRKETQSIKALAAIAMRIVFVGGLLVTVAGLVFPAQLIGIFTPDANVIAEGVRYVRVVAVSYLLFSVSQILIVSMRSVENVRIGLYISLSSLVCNVILNYIFIFGKLGAPAMGAAGAALATTISRVLEFGIIFVYAMFIDKKLSLKLKDFLLRDKGLLRDFIRYGLPVLGGNVVWAANVLTQSAIIGRMSAAAVASVSITGMLNNLVFVWVMGLGAAVGIVTGKTVGAGEYDTMKMYAKTVQVLFAILGVICGTAIFLLKDAFLSLYSVNAETLDVARQFMTVLSIAAVGRCYQATCLAGLVKAGGDTSFVFKNDTIFVFGVVLPSAIIAMFVFDAPAWVVYACLQSDQIIKCFVALIKINRFKWMKNLTHAESKEVGTKPA